jgi:flotillin
VPEEPVFLDLPPPLWYNQIERIKEVFEMEIFYYILGGVAVLLFLVFVTSYIKAGPDEAIMISGCGKRKILIGKAGFRIPFLQRTDKLSLKAFQVDIKTDEPIPTKEFININVDGVANLKVSSDPVKLGKAFEAILRMPEKELINQLQQVLQGNMREIIGTVAIKQLVQDRQGVAEQVKQNVVPDMEKLGIDLVNFNIQSFCDNDHVIENLGIDNVAQISKDASIARANAERDVAIAKAAAEEASNKSRVEAQTKITEQNTELSLKQSELKQKTETAKAIADASYEIENQKRKEQINIATVNATIAQKEREVELGNRQVELEERRLRAEINKKAEAQKYATEQQAQANLFARQKAAEAEKFELERKAEIKKIQAEAEKVAKERDAEALKISAEAEAAATVAKANAARDAALAEAEGIRAKGEAEAEAIKKKADAMKQYGEAATLQLILDSGVLPAVVEAYSKPMAEAYSHIGSITMFGDGNNARLAQELSVNGSQIVDGLNTSLGIDIKSILAGYLGAKILDNKKDADTTA